MLFLGCKDRIHWATGKHVRANVYKMNKMCVCAVMGEKQKGSAKPQRPQQAPAGTIDVIPRTACHIMGAM